MHLSLLTEYKSQLLHLNARFLPFNVSINPLDPKLHALPVVGRTRPFGRNPGIACKRSGSLPFTKIYTEMSMGTKHTGKPMCSTNPLCKLQERGYKLRAMGSPDPVGK